MPPSWGSGVTSSHLANGKALVKHLGAELDAGDVAVGGVVGLGGPRPARQQSHGCHQTGEDGEDKDADDDVIHAAAFHG